jgi:ParB-like chromosome segregation protein Spo0J
VEQRRAGHVPAHTNALARAPEIARSIDLKRGNANGPGADSPKTHWLPVRALLPADSPRQSGEDVEHTRMLARIDARLPPIIVHRATMRVVDGTHRLSAALLRGDELIEVRLFDGTEQEAFVLAVRTNIAHGLPLSLADRTRAAERIIAVNPAWSDRAIAAAAGLGARTVANIRRRSREGAVEEVGARTGCDGRVRPLDNAAGRLRASAIIRARPEASLREVAREAGISPATVRDVRRRVLRGEDPVPTAARRAAPGDGRPGEQALGQGRPGDQTLGQERPGDQTSGGEGLGGESRGVGTPGGSAVVALLRELESDAALRCSRSGRTLLRWIVSRAVRPEERRDVAGNVPAHYLGAVAGVARACAEEWLELAADLEHRAANPA